MMDMHSYYDPQIVDQAVRTLRLFGEPEQWQLDLAKKLEEMPVREAAQFVIDSGFLDPLPDEG